MKWMVISYYTEDTPYEEVMNQFLLPSLKKFNIPHYIFKVQTQGSWYKNTAMKPALLMQAMEMFPDYDLVFLDADATIEQYPSLFDSVSLGTDLMVHYLDWNTWYKNNSDIKELLSGTMYISNNTKTKLMCMDWYNEATQTNEWEQKILDKVLKRGKFTIEELPLEYIYIKTMPNGKEPFIKIENPVIVHHQVSRQLKKIVNCPKPL